MNQQKSFSSLLLSFTVEHVTVKLSPNILNSINFLSVWYFQTRVFLLFSTPCHPIYLLFLKNPLFLWLLEHQPILILLTGFWQFFWSPFPFSRSSSFTSTLIWVISFSLHLFFRLLTLLVPYQYTAAASGMTDVCLWKWQDISCHGCFTVTSIWAFKKLKSYSNYITSFLLNSLWSHHTSSPKDWKHEVLRIPFPPPSLFFSWSSWPIRWT